MFKQANLAYHRISSRLAISSPDEFLVFFSMANYANQCYFTSLIVIFNCCSAGLVIDVLLILILLHKKYNFNLISLARKILNINFKNSYYSLGISMFHNDN